MNHTRPFALAAFLLAAAGPSLAQPAIEVTRVPEWGTAGPLEGRVDGVEPAEAAVATFINADGAWWMKPTRAAPLMPLRPDGTFSVNIVTGGVDRLATHVTLLLMPRGAEVPDVLGDPELPQELLDAALARLDIDRSPRALEFSGQTWLVKPAELVEWGPGPNWFSDDDASVWVDEAGLHLTIREEDGRWLCSEVICQEPLGLGTYRFVTESVADDLPLNAIAGIFTWDDYAPDQHFREIDIELGRWGEPNGDFAQYVVQPWDRPGNRHRFSYEVPELVSHMIEWTSGAIIWRTWRGDAPSPTPEPLLHEWAYSGDDLPAEPGRAQLRMNLWLIDGEPPASGRGVEMVVREFDFQPLP
ncbi:MAG: hypothetical protein GF320_13740 [Armatimonadia bacterium]|nr:hypothetical protein [Armatimonadia bacterium]